MKNILFVTSFSESGYTQYAKDFIESFSKLTPEGSTLWAYHHSNFRSNPLWEPNFKDTPNVKFHNLDNTNGLIPFKEATFNILKKTIGINSYSKVPWQLDAIKFTNKVFALSTAAVTLKDMPLGSYDWLVWIDADTIIKKKISSERLEHWLDDLADIVHLGRPTASTYSETSFIGFNLKRKRGLNFIYNLMETFLNGEFQHFKEWHDGFIFERILKLSTMNGVIAKNLSADVVGTLEAFKNSELGYYMEHKKGKLKEAPTAQVGNRADFTVNPVDCVEQTIIKDNLIANLSAITDWVQPCKQEGLKAIFVSGGPSIHKYLPEIKKAKEEGAYVFSVKHSYPVLLQNGIEPDFCVIIDPRSIEGVSTHGKNRKDLFKDISPKTTFLISSMAHSSVVPFFKERGAKVMGWHALTGELQELSPYIKGETKYKGATAWGTCSAIRGLGVVHSLGFRDITLVGYDSSLLEEPTNKNEVTDSGMRKYFFVSLLKGSTRVQTITNNTLPLEEGESRFWSTGELVALYQDFMTIIPQLDTLGCSITVMNDESTLIGKGWKNHLKSKLDSEQAPSISLKEMLSLNPVESPLKLELV